MHVVDDVTDRPRTQHAAGKELVMTFFQSRDQFFLFLSSDVNVIRGDTELQPKVRHVSFVVTARHT